MTPRSMLPALLLLLAGCSGGGDDDASPVDGSAQAPGDGSADAAATTMPQDASVEAESPLDASEPKDAGTTPPADAAAAPPDAGPPTELDAAPSVDAAPPVDAGPTGHASPLVSCMLDFPFPSTTQRDYVACNEADPGASTGATVSWYAGGEQIPPPAPTGSCVETFEFEADSGAYPSAGYFSAGDCPTGTACSVGIVDGETGMRVYQWGKCL